MGYMAQPEAAERYGLDLALSGWKQTTRHDEAFGVISIAVLQNQVWRLSYTRRTVCHFDATCASMRLRLRPY